MKSIAALLLLGVFLCGFTSATQSPSCRVVTGVQVEYENKGTALTRTYTQDAHIRSVLNYLRMLHPKGNAVPDFPAQSICRIRLQYSSGPDSVFLLQDAAYLRQNDGPWQQIDPQQTQLLYPLLLLLPSDP